MAWAKLAHASVHLYSLYGDGAPCGQVVAAVAAPHTIPTHSSHMIGHPSSPRRLPGLSGTFPAMLRNLLLQWSTPAKVWDVAAVVLRLGWAPPPPPSAEEAEAGGSAAVGGGHLLGSSGADGLLEEFEADGLAEAEAVLQLLEGVVAVLEGGYLQVRGRRRCFSYWRGQQQCWRGATCR